MEIIDYAVKIGDIGGKLMENESAFKFHGHWQDFFKIAIVNLLLTIITLGIYRFWATRREREYLWSQTEFIDERLEWTGTGLELFIGAVMVVILFIIPITIMQFILQGALMQDNRGLAIAIVVILGFLIFYLIGVAYFRALRYRLGRTYWRGIRGGSNDPGFKYGISYIWKNILGAVPIYLLVPWAMISLWNERWNQMSFGPHQFHSVARWEDLMKRYLMFYLIPFLLVIVFIYFGVQTFRSGGDIEAMTSGNIIFIGTIGALLILFYIALPLIALMFYSKYFRVAVSGLRLHNLEFSFGARTKDWIFLFLGNIALVIGTLGIGYIVIPYRNWKFFITHMEAYGEVNLVELTQSETDRSKHGEGLLDAFDVGAI